MHRSRLFGSLVMYGSVLAASMMVCVGGVARVAAGQYNAVLSIGDAAPQWDDLEGVDGRRHSSAELSAAPCVVVAFTCNSCPYARDVEDRLIALTNEFAESAVRVVAINVNLVDDDLLPAMKERAEEKAYPFAYLHDPTQRIARDFGAIKTPEFFVLDGQGKVAYMGALDDSPDGKAVTRRYVAEAVTAVLAGQQPAVMETVPIGCRVRYARDSRAKKSGQ